MEYCSEVFRFNAQYHSHLRVLGRIQLVLDAPYFHIRKVLCVRITSKFVSGVGLSGVRWLECLSPCNSRLTRGPQENSKLVYS